MKIFLKNNLWIIIVVVCAFFVMVPKLSSPYFWQDEAETGLLARSILSEGVPMAWDGTNLITQLSGNDSNSEYVWSFTPWLPFYIVAGSFKILGESNFAGRIPFVLIGIFGLLGIYCFALKYSGNRYTALLSALLLLLNMQFLLYSRQCKYYSIFFLVPPFMYLAYADIHKRVLKFILFTFFVVVLFYTNYVSLFTSIIGLIVYTFLVRREKRHILSFVLAGIISLCITVPFLFVGDFGTSATVISKFPSIAEYADKLVRHIWYFNNMVFGVCLFIPLGIFIKKKYFTEREMKTIKFLLCLIFSAWLVLPLFNQDVFRYNLHLIPFFMFLTAIIVVALLRRSKVVGSIFLFLIVTTNIFSNLPGILTQTALKVAGVSFEEKSEWFSEKFNKDIYKSRQYFKKLDEEIYELTLKKIFLNSILKMEYVAYYKELTTDYTDAVEIVVNFFKNNAKRGESIYSNFATLSVIYYLPYLKAAYLVDTSKLMRPKLPPLPEYVTSVKDVDWYFYRDLKMNLGPYLANYQFFEIMNKSGKKVIPYNLGISSLYWEMNWPQRFNQYVNKMFWQDTRGYDDVAVYRIEDAIKVDVR